MLAREGDRAIIKVLDFGLAKASREQPLDRALHPGRTDLGTPDYIAPEQTLDAQGGRYPGGYLQPGLHTLLPAQGRSPRSTGSSLFEILLSHQSKDATPLDLLRTDVPAVLSGGRRQDDGRAAGPSVPDASRGCRALVPFFKGGKTAPPLTIMSPPASQRTSRLLCPWARPSSSRRPATYLPRPRACKVRPFRRGRQTRHRLQSIQGPVEDPGKEQSGCGRPWRRACSCSPGSPPGRPGSSFARHRKSPNRTGSLQLSRPRQSLLSRRRKARRSRVLHPLSQPRSRTSPNLPRGMADHQDCPPGSGVMAPRVRSQSRRLRHHPCLSEQRALG